MYTHTHTHIPTHPHTQMRGVTRDVAREWICHLFQQIIQTSAAPIEIVENIK